MSMVFSITLAIVLQAVYVCGTLYPRDEEIQKAQAINNRPIIGVMMQSTEGMPFESLGTNYIAASYIKYLESSGARVAPIWNDLSESEAEKLFYSINGILFPGGDVDPVNSDYAKVGRIMLNLAKTSFDKGDYFPVWGTCLGHEYISVYVTGNKSILTRTNSENITLTLKFTEDYKDSKIFYDLPIELEIFLSSVPSTSNFHDWSVTVESFNNNREMKAFYNVLSTSVDRNGTEFVSTMEGKKYPFFSTQWHPEKNSFEWSTQSNLSHVAQAILSTQYMSNFFVNQARLSMHKFKSEDEEQAALIYNYTPRYTGANSGFEQCYFFGASNSRSEPLGHNIHYRHQGRRWRKLYV